MTRDIIHIYTIRWRDPVKGVQETMTDNPDFAESQSRAGATVTAESRPVT